MLSWRLPGFQFPSRRGLKQIVINYPINEGLYASVCDKPKILDSEQHPAKVYDTYVYMCVTYSFRIS